MKPHQLDNPLTDREQVHSHLPLGGDEWQAVSMKANLIQPEFLYIQRRRENLPETSDHENGDLGSEDWLCCLVIEWHVVVAVFMQCLLSAFRRLSSRLSRIDKA